MTTASTNGRLSAADIDALTREVAGLRGDDVARMAKFAESARNYWAARAKRDEDTRKAAERGAKDYAPNVLRTVSERLEADGLDVIEAFDAAKDSLGRVSGVERPAAGEGGLLAKRVKVGEKIEAGIPPVSYAPGELAHRMVYAKGVTVFSGHPESGKTSLTARLALDCMAVGENVVYMDWENGWEETGRRLEDMGAGLDLDKRLCYIPHPGPPDWAEYARIAAEWPDALWVFDAARGLLGSLGINENDASEVGQALNPLVDFAIKHGLPAILIDHVTKAEDGSSGYARGSGDKLAAIQGQYYVKKTRDFSEREAGEIELKRWKARSGRLDVRHRFKVGDGRGNLTFERLDAAASLDGKRDADIIAFLKRIAPADASLNEIKRGGVEGRAAKIRERVKDLAETEGRPVKTAEGSDAHPRYAFDPGADGGPGVPF